MIQKYNLCVIEMKNLLCIFYYVTLKDEKLKRESKINSMTQSMENRHED